MSIADEPAVELRPAPVRQDKSPAANPAPDLKGRVQKLRLDSSSETRRPLLGGVSWLPWLLCAMLAFAWGGVALRTYRNQSDDTSNVSTTPATNSSGSMDANGAPDGPKGTILLEVKGYLIPAQQIAVSPIDVGGRLIELNFVEGKKFPKGHVLARLDASSYKASYDEALQALASAQQRTAAAKKRWEEQMPESVREIELKQVQAELDEAKALELRAKQEIERLDSVKTTVAISIREYQQAQSDYAAAKARVIRLAAGYEILIKGPRPERIAAAKADYDAAVADEQAAEARVRQAKWRYDNCEIKAPIEGTILTKKAEQWNLVNPMAFGSTSGSICDMADLGNMEVEAEIAEGEIRKIKVGQPCRIKTEAFPTRLYEGNIDRILPIANRSKSIFSVRVKVKIPAGEEPGMYLKPEMGAVVSFLKDE